MKTIIIALMLVLTAGIILAIVLPIIIKHGKTTMGVVNYNALMRKFVYRTGLSKSEIVNRLCVRNADDEMEYSFDEDVMTVEFQEYGEAAVKYSLQIDDYNGYCILRLEQITAVAGKIAYRMNPFWAGKIEAQMIPFEMHGF